MLWKKSASHSLAGFDVVDANAECIDVAFEEDGDDVHVVIYLGSQSGRLSRKRLINGICGNTKSATRHPMPKMSRYPARMARATTASSAISGVMYLISFLWLPTGGKTLIFLYCDQESYGDRSYYFCKEDGKVYSDYFSIGD